MSTRWTSAAADLASAAWVSSAATGSARSVGAKAKRASIEKRFMVPPDRKRRAAATGHELDESEAAHHGQPQADDVRELLLDGGGVEGEEHGTRDHRHAELAEDVERPAAVLGEAAGARGAHALDHADGDDDARERKAERRRQPALGEDRHVQARRNEGEEDHRRR